MVSRKAEFCLSQNLNFRRLPPTGRPSMNEVNLLESLGQVSSSQTGQVLRDFSARSRAGDDLRSHGCGGHRTVRPPGTILHHRITFVRALLSGRVLVEGEQEQVVRPRVRRQTSLTVAVQSVKSSWPATRAAKRSSAVANSDCASDRFGCQFTSRRRESPEVAWRQAIERFTALARGWQEVR